MRRVSIVTTAAILLAGSLALAQETPDERALTLIKKLGGSFQKDEDQPGRPIVMVDLSGGKASDADVEQFKGLTRLRALNLNLTRVTDAGLAHLQAMKQLEELGLGLTAVGDAGMVHLKGLKGLKRMDLRATKLTDVGLGHLQALTGLEVLDVDGTKVTDAGVRDFLKAVPKAAVIRQKPKP